MEGHRARRSSASFGVLPPAEIFMRTTMSGGGARTRRPPVSTSVSHVVGSKVTGRHGRARSLSQSCSLGNGALAEAALLASVPDEVGGLGHVDSAHASLLTESASSNVDTTSGRQPVQPNGVPGRPRVRSEVMLSTGLRRYASSLNRRARCSIVDANSSGTGRTSVSSIDHRASSNSRRCTTRCQRSCGPTFRRRPQ